jgi:hypothetical protein
MTMKDVYRCRCGEWTGEYCPWTGPLSAMVVVEFMPEYLREQHEAAGNSGVYPHNGAIRVAVERSCARDLLGREGEGEWSAIRTDLKPGPYAERAPGRG